MLALLVLLVLAVLFALGWATLYNGLVTKRNAYKNAFSQIDVQLKRRYDLIPNLVETAKGYLKHERGTLEAVIAARNTALTAARAAAAAPGDPKAMQGLSAAEGALAAAFRARTTASSVSRSCFRYAFAVSTRFGTRSYRRLSWTSICPNALRYAFRRATSPL